MQTKKVIAVFIAYKAVKTLEKFYNEFPKHLVDEIILVDDASGDGTYELSKKLGIESYANPINLGYGGNMKRALDIALEKGADVIIDIHPDGEYKPSAISPALQEIRKGSQFVLGNRLGVDKTLRESGMYAWKIIPIFFLNWIDRVVLGLHIHDFHQGFRVYTKDLLQVANYKVNSNNYLFSFELIAQAAFHGIKVTEVPVETVYEGKKRGASLKNSLKYSFGTFKILFWYMLARVGVKNKLFAFPRENPYAQAVGNK